MRLQHVVPGIRSIRSRHNLSRLYRQRDRTAPRVMSTPSRNARRAAPPPPPLHPPFFIQVPPLFLIYIYLFHTDCSTYRHAAVPQDQPRAPKSGDGHFPKSATRVSVRRVTAMLTRNRGAKRGRVRSERFASPPERPSESPEISESGRGAGVEFHSVAERQKVFFFLFLFSAQVCR